ncbi:class I glutamine amidotransferase-like protein [Microdochium trichocladiopsis]|uniref:Class I glutamine amidotransferase-like protein n=1 Tax=Microdochium trichocladiopsis TaxID=1682393 RepID=A0A9P9BWC3_9PEZI|nr:class I glutamine amidotransferase-like protein [Microdochium trichocladiopsis]KAH7034936.1 class I glutamine amidotransferase-like protein [Microdochium trichocladiopsis]
MAPAEARTIVSSHPDSVRMLVLETDEPHPDTQRERGSFGEVLNELFQRAGEAHEPKLGIETLMMYAVEPEGGRIPDAEEIGDDVHAILITGSVYDAHSDEEWVLKLLRLIQELWKTRPDIRFTGICFGHQILCRALGSKVKPQENNEWELSHTRLTLNDVGRRLFAIPPHDPPHIHLHEMHLDHVVQAPVLDPAEHTVHVWATSEHTDVQGVYIQGRLFTSQGHMEFDEDMVRRQLEMRVESGSLDAQEAREAEARAEWMHDGLVVAKAVLRFFHGDDDDI